MREGGREKIIGGEIRVEIVFGAIIRTLAFSLNRGMT